MTLTGAEDMDNCKDVGATYHAPFDSIAIALTHSPFDHAFSVQVLRTGSGKYKQIATEGYTGDVKTRIYNGSWSTWTLLATALGVTAGTFTVPGGGALKIEFSGKYQLIASILGTSTYVTSSAMVSGYSMASNRNRCTWIINPSGNDVHIAVSDTLKELYIFNGTTVDVTVSITELLHASTITCTVINNSTTLSGYTYIDSEQ